MVGSRLTASVMHLIALGLLAGSAHADSSSASYTLRGAHVSASGAQATSTSFNHVGTLGQSESIGPAGSAIDLGSIVPGFAPILAGELPSLDLDGDGAAYFLDSDDDGDGLDDVVETNLGSYLSPSNTGTDSLLADSDGDGVDDGVEVAAGSDPTDPFSLPGSTPVPLFGLAGRMGIVLLLAFTSAWAMRPRGFSKSDYS